MNKFLFQQKSSVILYIVIIFYMLCIQGLSFVRPLHKANLCVTGYLKDAIFLVGAWSNHMSKGQLTGLLLLNFEAPRSN